MTLLTVIFAAVISTVLWYTNLPDDKMKFGILSLMYWGASLMWLVDAAAEYLEIGADFFAPAVSDMLNDAYLGLCAVALGLVIWLVILLIKDPKGVIRNMLKKN